METWAPISMSNDSNREIASQSEVRPVADGRAAHRWSADGTVQLAPGPPRRRRAGAADRGHRPRALDAGERRADPGRAALARARLGRGPGEPVRARRQPPRRRWSGCWRAAPPTATRPPPTTSRPGRSSTASRRATAALPSEDPAAAVRLHVPDEGDTVVSRPDPRRGPVPERGRRRLRDRPRGRIGPLQLRGRGRRRRDGDHRRDPRRRPPLQHPEAAAGDGGAGGRRRRATPTCRCCTAPTARSSPSATAPPACRSCARAATCRRPSATTWRCWAGGPTTTPRS